jgi:hypothetical protein
LLVHECKNIAEQVLTFLARQLMLGE